MTKPSVLAFDLAGSVGVAYGQAGGVPRSTTVNIGSRGPEGERLATMLRATRAFLTEFPPDVLAYEAPVGGPKTSHFLVALVGCFVGQATLMGFEPRSCAIASVRKHFLGRHLTHADYPRGWTRAQSRAAIKAAVIARCGLLGWHPKSDDEADALAVWDYAAATLGRAQAAPLGGLFDGRRS